MPMNTMLVRRGRRSSWRRRPFVEASRATSTWATISAAVEVAHQPLGAGVAEGAVQRAADLAGDASVPRSTSGM